MTQDFDLTKRQINVQLDEYEQEIADYAAFMEGWRARNPKRQPLYSEEVSTAAE